MNTINYLLHFLVPAVQHFHMLGYWIALAAAMAETVVGVGLFVPGSTIVLQMGALAAGGYFDLGDLIWFALIGAIAGDALNYYLGRRYGQRILTKGLWFIKAAHFKKGQAFLNSRGARSIMLARFIPSMKEIAPLAAGAVKMRPRNFFVWNILGAIGWSLLWILPGYFFAQSLGLASQWISRAGFLFIIIIVCAAIFYLLKYLIAKNAQAWWRLVKSVWSSILTAVADNDEVKKFITTHPRLVNFINARWDNNYFQGRLLTLLIVAFAYLLGHLAGLVEDIIKSEAIVNLDQQVAGWLIHWRYHWLIKIFFLITQLGTWPVVTAILIAVIILLWLLPQRRYIWPLLISLGGSIIFSTVGKFILQRPRPVGAAYAETSFSFPSSHAVLAVAFYGLLIYIWARQTKHWRQKVNIAFAGLALIILIGLSRLYLGVHYLSDVLAGYLLGALWLIIAISLAELHRPPPRN